MAKLVDKLTNQARKTKYAQQRTDTMREDTDNLFAVAWGLILNSVYFYIIFDIDIWCDLLTISDKKTRKFNRKQLNKS